MDVSKVVPVVDAGAISAASPVTTPAQATTPTPTEISAPQTLAITVPSYIDKVKFIGDFEDFYEKVKDKTATKEEFLQDISNTIGKNIDIIVAFSDPKVVEFPAWFEDGDTPHEAVIGRDEFAVDYVQHLSDTYVIATKDIEAIMESILEYIEDYYYEQVPESFRA